YKAKYGDDIPAQFHPDIRSRQACKKSTELAISLARKHNTRLHVLHISTADELALFQAGPIEGKRITAETCIHFLRFDRDDYAKLGHQIKCNPAIKDPADREALIRAVAEDVIDVLATDHAPHTLE
ncbi:dihydroorotase, partial [Lysobacter sp. 2RAB21]